MSSPTLVTGLRVAQPCTPSRGAAARRAQAVVPPATAWLERLARWAERQPAHRRLGMGLDRVR